MKFNTLAVCVYFFYILTASGINVTLNKVSSIRIPHSYGSIEYQLDDYDANAITYDTKEKIMYCVGWYSIHVIDVSDVLRMRIIHHISESGKFKTDVEFCGGFVLVTVDDWDERENGRLDIYRRYDKATEEMELFHSIFVGVQPTMVLPTRDCKTVLVIIEAEIDTFHGVMKDFQGSVAVIKFPTTLDDTYTMKILNFSHYDNRIASLESKGVRFVNRENGNSFSNDAQPESITLSSDETKAYVALQTNNAIAVLDLESEEIVQLHGLGYKDWRKYTMDASDRDGGINLKSWPVYGMYQPGDIQLMTINGVDYIVSANEGKSNDRRCCFKEEIRVKDVDLSEMFDTNVTRKAKLQKDELLGRLEVSKVTGYNATTGAHDALYTFGARGFSIWYASNMSLAYDSGDEIPVKIAALYPDLFNCDVSEGYTPQEMSDVESDEKGEETKTIALARIDLFTLIILGIKRPGLLFAYSVDETKPYIEPEFEGLYHDIQRLDKNWEDLVDNGEASMLEPGDIKYIPDIKSPNGQNIIAVAGTASGTVTLLELGVTIENRGSKDAPPKSIDTAEKSIYTTERSTYTTTIKTNTTSVLTSTPQRSIHTTPNHADTTSMHGYTNTTRWLTNATRMSPDTVQWPQNTTKGPLTTTDELPDTSLAETVNELPLVGLVAISTGSAVVALGFISAIVHHIIFRHSFLARTRTKEVEDIRNATLSQQDTTNPSLIRGRDSITYQNKAKKKVEISSNYKQTVHSV